MTKKEENWIESEATKAEIEEQERREWEKLVQEWVDLDRKNRGEEVDS